LSQGALECRELKNDLRIVRDAHKRTFTSTYFEELQLETRKLAKDTDTVPQPRIRYCTAKPLHAAKAFVL